MEDNKQNQIDPKLVDGMLGIIVNIIEKHKVELVSTKSKLRTAKFLLWGFVVGHIFLMAGNFLGLVK